MNRLLLSAVFAALCAGCGSKVVCSNKCLNAGLAQCAAGGKVQTCSADANGCLDWSAAVACSGQQFCDSVQSKCVACANGCTSAGATQCAGSQVQTCATDANGCQSWGAATACPGSEYCDNVQQKCLTCVNTCPQASSTQCAGQQLQTCMANAQGCLAWSLAADCPTAGQVCDGGQNKCVDVCTTTAVASACTAAANQVNQCCGGTQPAATATSLCRAALAAGQDPQVQCSGQSSSSCANQSSQALSASQCCCPAGQTCDPENNGACVPACTSKADCATSDRGHACAPVAVNDVAGTRYVCRPHDGMAWHGCLYTANTFSADQVSCAPGYECWAPLSTEDWSNGFCTRSCSSAVTCGTACCAGACRTGLVHSSSTEFSCGGSGGCMPCQ